MRKDRLALILSWALGLTVSALAFIAWGAGNAWHLNNLSTYQLFPVLGLIAFSLMWSHYFIGTIRDLCGIKPEALASYFRLTGYAVLGLICLHPGLLIYQLYVDGVGFPPLSYERYVAPGLGWVTLLGTASLFVFLAFELHRVYGKKPWFRYVVDASDFAMLAIVYHGLRLGSQLQHGWYRWVWWIYALTLTAILVRKYWLRLNQPKAKARV